MGREPDRERDPGERASRLARDILALTRDSLLVALRFMSVALCQLEWAPAGPDDIDPAGGGVMATDGRWLFYDARNLPGRYRGSREQLNRDYLHLVLHCLFYHPFAIPGHRDDCWHLACDVAVENIITELGLRQTASAHDAEQRSILLALKKEIKVLTAERIYHHYLDQDIPAERAVALRRLFYRDDHAVWTRLPEPLQPDGNPDGSGGEGSASQRGWQAISERVQVDLETASRQWSGESTALIQNIQAANREHIDYRSFLERFMIQGEAMQINDNEFDYVYYAYGFSLYKNMPLIEPLEYKEVRKIRDFVIAIDTSGSCSGELVQAFIRKTCNILRQSENFFQQFNVHILQCDAEIRSVAHITDLADFERYIQEADLRGFGLTDFRPVFRYVDQAIAARVFTNLKGLIYFTDGLGHFPEQQPAYDTAFVFLDPDEQQPAVPGWAIRLVLTREDLTG